MYSALDIANYVLGYYYEKNRLCISNLKLQKILYFLQAEFLVSKKKPLFKDEIEAYGFGPVVYEVNKRYWIHGKIAITEMEKGNLSQMNNYIISFQNH